MIYTNKPVKFLLAVINQKQETIDHLRSSLWKIKKRRKKKKRIMDVRSKFPDRAFKRAKKKLIGPLYEWDF